MRGRLRNGSRWWITGCLLAGFAGLTGGTRISELGPAEAAISGPDPATAAPPDTLTTTQRGAIDRFIHDAMDELDLVPGLSAAVVLGDRIVYAEGFGWADVERQEPVTAETIFYVASLSKAQTAMAAAVLDVEGRLDLDDPVTRWLPELSFPDSLAPADSTSLRDLLRHTPRFLNGGVNFYTTFVGRYADDDLVRVLNGYSRANRGFQYSNMAFAIASRILGKAGGEPWQDVVAGTVFEPVGMVSTTARASELPARGVATPYTRTASGYLARPPLKTDDKITGAGGYFSTATDLARYVVANLNDGRVDGRQALPTPAVREVQRPQTTVDADFFEYHRHHYGLGLYLADYDDETLVHHFGGIPGGFRSHMSWMPEHRIGVVVLQNASGAGGGLPEIVANYVYDLLLGRPEVEARARARLDTLAVASPDRIEAATRQAARLDSVGAVGHVPALGWNAYVGTYENERLGRVRIRPGSDALRVDWGEIDAPMISLGGNDFLVRWQPGYAPATWSFQLENDRVTGFDWGGRAFPRVAGGL